MNPVVGVAFVAALRNQRDRSTNSTGAWKDSFRL